MHGFLRCKQHVLLGKDLFFKFIILGLIDYQCYISNDISLNVFYSRNITMLY